MRNLKKIVSLVLAMMMVLSLMVTASATNFADDAEISYKEAVEVMTGIGVINGVGDKFLPKDTLNREAAAKIVAYIMTGSEPDKTITDAMANPFTDVSGWSESVIKFCYNMGIVDGLGNGTFLPKDNLTGYAFAKMVLLAAGVEGEYTGANWKLNIATAAKKAGILKGLETVSLSKVLTREEAVQMAFNAINYSATGTSSVYVVKTSDGVEIYRGTDALTALIMKQAEDGNTLSLDTVNTGSLGDTVFALKESTMTDDFGRVSKAWVNKEDSTKVYAAVAPTPVLTYTTAITEGKLAAALGCKLVADKVEITVITNGNTATAKEITKVDETTPVTIGGQGTLVEVYKTAAGKYNVIVVETFAKKLEAGDIHAAVPATAGSDAVPAYITLEDQNYVTNAFKAGDVVLYTKHTTDGTTADKISNVVKAPSVSGMVTATSAAYGYIRVNGTAMLLADNNADSAVIGTTAGYTYTTTDVYTYYTDAYGNVIAAVAGTPVQAEVNYFYVLSTAAKAATSQDGDLYNPASGTAAAAQTMVMDLATGEISVLNQGVVKGTDNKYYYAAADGSASSTEVIDQAITPVGAIKAYTKLADGSVVIGGNAELTSVTLEKNNAAIATGKFATPNTKVTILTHAADWSSVTKTEYTGLANFPVNALTKDALVVANATTGAVSSITIVTAAEAVTTAPDYAVYAGAGEFGANGQAYAFMVGGKLVNYYLAKDVDATAAGLTAASFGNVVTLKLTDGKLGAGAVEVQGVDKIVGYGEVTYVDETFLVIGGTPYYFAEGCETIIGSNGTCALSTVNVGDTVALYGAVDAVAFIVK